MTFVSVNGRKLASKFGLEGNPMTKNIHVDRILKNKNMPADPKIIYRHPLMAAGRARRRQNWDWRDERDAKCLLDPLRERMEERGGWSSGGFKRLANI